MAEHHGNSLNCLLEGHVSNQKRRKKMIFQAYPIIKSQTQCLILTKIIAILKIMWIMALKKYNLHLKRFPMLVLKGKPSTGHLLMAKEKPMSCINARDTQCNGDCFSDYDSLHGTSQELHQGPGHWKILSCCYFPAWNELHGLWEALECHQSIIFTHGLPILIFLS